MMPRRSGASALRNVQLVASNDQFANSPLSRGRTPAYDGHRQVTDQASLCLRLGNAKISDRKLETAHSRPTTSPPQTVQRLPNFSKVLGTWFAGDRNCQRDLPSASCVARRRPASAPALARQPAAPSDAALSRRPTRVEHRLMMARLHMCQLAKMMATSNVHG